MMTDIIVSRKEPDFIQFSTGTPRMKFLSADTEGCSEIGLFGLLPMKKYFE